MGHTHSNVLIHVIFSTKDRRPMIDDSFRDRLYEYLGGIARKEFGSALKIGGTDNHLHALLSIGTDLSIGRAMTKWKSLSSSWIRRNIRGAGAFAWQVGYGVFSVSQSKAGEVARYIDNQRRHHAKVTFEDEYVRFLKRHGVAFDPAELWE